jgi:YesN/AraC family two-component response regulator
MSGDELARVLREREPSLKVLFFSGYTDDAIVQRGIEHDGLDYIQKPYSHVDLSRKIREVLDRDS